MAERTPLFHGETKLSPIQRGKFIDAVKPHAEIARRAHKTVKSFERLNQEETLIESLDNESTRDSDTETLIGWLDEIGQARRELGGEDAQIESQNIWQTTTNEIIAQVHQLKETKNAEFSTFPQPSKKKATREVAQPFTFPDGTVKDFTGKERQLVEHLLSTHGAVSSSKLAWVIWGDKNNPLEDASKEALRKAKNNLLNVKRTVGQILYPTNWEIQNVTPATERLNGVESQYRLAKKVDVAEQSTAEESHGKAAPNRKFMAIARRPLSKGEDERRLEFIKSVKGSAVQSRGALRLTREITGLEKRYAELTDQFVALNRDLQNPHVIQILEERKEAADRLELLGGAQAKKIAQEDLRKYTNEVIRKTNQFKARKQIEKGVIYPEASNLIGRQQIPFTRETMAQREPDSPGLPHNDLGQLTIYKDNYLNAILLAEIKAACKKRWPEDSRMADTAIAVARVLSRHILEGGYTSTPLPFRNIREITDGIIRVVDLVVQYKDQTLLYPTPDDFAVRKEDQPEQIKRFVEVTLADFLYQELMQPHRNENQIRQMYQAMCNQLRQAAELVGGLDRFELVARAIEELDPVEHALAVTRLSNNLNFDFGFIGGDIASERRFAEALRDVPFRIERERKRFEKNKADSDLSVDMPGEHILAAIIEALNDRMEDQDIDLEAIAKDLASVGYTKRIIKQLWKYTTGDEKEILMQFFRQTSNLEKFVPEENEDDDSNKYKEDDPAKYS